MKMEIERLEVKFSEDERKWRLRCLWYTDDAVLFGESEEDLRMVVGRFIEVHKRNGLKVNRDKCKMILLGGEGGLVCEVTIDLRKKEYTS